MYVNLGDLIEAKCNKIICKKLFSLKNPNVEKFLNHSSKLHIKSGGQLGKGECRLYEVYKLSKARFIAN